MGDLLQPWHLILLAIVALLVFGAKRLPELGKGLGEGLKGFREGIKGTPDPAPTPAPQAPVQQAAAVLQGAAPHSTALSAGKVNYRCPNCKNVVTANAPNPNVPDEKGFCPECGSQFDKKSALL
jgi:sec-independent protein translocase protein TatA